MPTIRLSKKYFRLSKRDSSPGRFEYFILKGNWPENEFVFPDPGGIEMVESIYVRQGIKTEILEAIKDVNPPQGRKWEHIMTEIDFTGHPI